MTARLITAADRKIMPWKNGMGITEEIAASSASNDLSDFQWRLSMAHINTSCQFSRFENVTRHLAVLSGELELTFDGKSTLSLATFSVPCSFSGEIPVSARPLDGAVTDLNLMTTPPFDGRMFNLGSDHKLKIAHSAKITAIIARNPVIVRSSDELECYVLSPKDAVLLSGPTAKTYEISNGSILIAEVYSI